MLSLSFTFIKLNSFTFSLTQLHHHSHFYHCAVQLQHTISLHTSISRTCLNCHVHHYHNTPQAGLTHLPALWSVNLHLMLNYNCILQARLRPVAQPISMVVSATRVDCHQAHSLPSQHLPTIVRSPRAVVAIRAIAPRRLRRSLNQHKRRAATSTRELAAFCVAMPRQVPAVWPVVPRMCICWPAWIGGIAVQIHHRATIAANRHCYCASNCWSWAANRQAVHRCSIDGE